MNLSKSEEQVMNYLWKLKKAFIKDLLKEFPDPKPATTTVLTLLKRMKGKGYVDFKVFGNSREYFPLVEKKDYVKGRFKGMVRDFFNDSPIQLASFFASEADLTKEQLAELRDIIDQKIDEDDD